MKVITKMSKNLADVISKVSTKIAYTSTKECANLCIEEPKMPKVLLEKMNK